MNIISSYEKGIYLGFNFSKSKVKAWRFYARLFFLIFRKVVIVLLKCKLSTLEMTIIILEDTNRLKGYRDQDFLSNKKKERNKKRVTRKKKKNSPFSYILEIIFSSFLFLSFSIDMQSKVIFLSWKGTKTFRFKKLWDLFYIFFSIYMMSMNVFLYLFSTII